MPIGRFRLLFRERRLAGIPGPERRLQGRSEGGGADGAGKARQCRAFRVVVGSGLRQTSSAVSGGGVRLYRVGMDPVGFTAISSV